METSARPVRQNYRLGNEPDRAAFYQQLSKEVKKQLSPLSQLTTPPKTPFVVTHDVLARYPELFGRKNEGRSVPVNQ